MNTPFVPISLFIFIILDILKNRLYLLIYIIFDDFKIFLLKKLIECRNIKK